jgi:hypothetical protein
MGEVYFGMRKAQWKLRRSFTVPPGSANVRAHDSNTLPERLRGPAFVRHFDSRVAGFPPQ